MFCGNCGTQLDDNEKFCPNCGEKIIRDEEQAPQAYEPVPSSEPFPGGDPPMVPPSPPEFTGGGRKKKAIIIAIIIVAAAAVAAIVGYFVYQNSPIGRYNERINTGQKYLNEADYQNALIAFNEAIEILPNRADAYVHIGETYEAMGDYQSAIDVIYDAMNVVDDNRNMFDDYMNDLWNRANEYFFYGDGAAVLEGIVTVADYDTDFSNNEFLEDAYVELTVRHVDISGRDTYTDSQGLFTFDGLREGLYEIHVYKDGYIPATMVMDVNSSEVTIYSGMIELIPEEYEGSGSASGRIVDALDGSGVGDISLVFREGSDNLSGEIIGEAMTDSGGRYTSPTLPAGNYCAVITDVSEARSGSDSMYVETYMNVKVLGGEDIPNQDGTVTTHILDGQLRVVLSWGEYPWDLDSHLVCPGNSMVEGDSDDWDYGAYTGAPEVFYGNREVYTPGGELLAFLDLDDTDSYGPETTTIYATKGGDFTFYVFDYTNVDNPGAGEMQYSGAYVRVYKGNNNVPSASFAVPRGSGIYWSVFSYDSEADTITPINTIGGGVRY